MAEYYPLLAKAIGTLPNSTPDSRRVVYERARKALIGQLRTLHPPVPDADIERESVALDRAVERLESELAKGLVPGTPPAVAGSAPAQGRAPVQGKPTEQGRAAEQAKTPALRPPPLPGSAVAPADKPPIPPLRPRPPKSPEPTPPGLPPSADPAAPPPAPRPPAPRPSTDTPAAPRSPLKPPGPAVPTSERRPPAPAPDAAPAPPVPSAPAQSTPADQKASEPALNAPVPLDDAKRIKPSQRPIAPQPPGASQPKRRLWIVPVIVLALVGIVAAAAWKLRDRPELLTRNKPAEQTQADKGKISERVGAPSEPEETEKPSPADSPKSSEPTDKGGQAADSGTQPTDKGTQQAEQAPASSANNPAVPVAHRAALLVEAPDEPNKVKTFLGTVVWKLDNAPQGANAAVGLAVEADVEIPDDKLKAVVIFEKNTDASLPASHTVKVRFTLDPGSFSGNVKQIGALQMRSESSPNVETLAGATVPITTNSFLVGLSPGNAESANTELIRRLQWFDIPLMLESGKIAKLTFEKSDSGQRDLNEAFEAWQKQ